MNSVYPLMIVDSYVMEFVVSLMRQTDRLEDGFLGGSELVYSTEFLVALPVSPFDAIVQ